MYKCNSLGRHRYLESGAYTYVATHGYPCVYVYIPCCTDGPVGTDLVCFGFHRCGAEGRGLCMYRFTYICIYTYICAYMSIRLNVYTSIYGHP